MALPAHDFQRPPVFPFFFFFGKEKGSAGGGGVAAGHDCQEMVNSGPGSTTHPGAYSGCEKVRHRSVHHNARFPEHARPLSWSSPQFTLSSFDFVYLPGGHDKAVRQIIESSTVHKHLAEYFPLTRKSSTSSQKAIAAICHGPLVLANTINPETGKSVLYECKTTALPAGFERLAYWGTRLWLGDYYKTYGKGSEDVEFSVKKILKDGGQFMSSLSPSP